MFPMNKIYRNAGGEGRGGSARERAIADRRAKSPGFRRGGSPAFSDVTRSLTLGERLAGALIPGAGPAILAGRLSQDDPTQKPAPLGTRSREGNGSAPTRRKILVASKTGGTTAAKQVAKKKPQKRAADTRRSAVLSGTGLGSATVSRPGASTLGG